MMNKKIDLVAFNLVMDDLLLPSGEHIPNLLGGGGPQTAFGMRLWSKNVGLFASVSPDLPVNATNWLNQAQINQQGLIYQDGTTLHSRQVFTASGERRHEWLTPIEDIRRHFSLTCDHLPESYRRAKSYHIGIHPESPNWTFLMELRALAGCLSIETFRPSQRPLSKEELHRLVSLPEIFSCNWHEGWSLTGQQEPVAILKNLLSAGAKVVALHLGSQGSIAAQTGDYRYCHVPAYATDADPLHPALGAGNTYCGGFLAGWLISHDLVRSASCGSAAASFMLEQVGLPGWRVDLPSIADERARQLASLASDVG